MWRPFVPAEIAAGRLEERPEFGALNAWLATRREPFGLEDALAHRRGTPRRTVEKYLKRLAAAGAFRVHPEDARLLRKKGLA